VSGEAPEARRRSDESARPDTSPLRRRRLVKPDGRTLLLYKRRDRR
jgi:hypothetical protein